jgi:hypothetical protein
MKDHTRISYGLSLAIKEDTGVEESYAVQPRVFATLILHPCC